MYFLFLLCMECSASAGEVRALVKDAQGRLLEDAVITAMPLDLRNIPKQIDKKTVDQMGKEFIPHVKPIYVNSLIYFPNNDDIRHHVYSFSPAKKFELPLYSGSSAPLVLFDKPGVVTLGCNIHDWMLGYIYVSATPYFIKSEQDGKGLIRDIPAGEYVIKVWHPQLIGTEESTARRITISNNGAVDLEWQLPLKPAFKIPRASAGKGFGGY
jgi:hypothetical protein